MDINSIHSFAEKLKKESNEFKVTKKKSNDTKFLEIF